MLRASNLRILLGGRDAAGTGSSRKHSVAYPARESGDCTKYQRHSHVLMRFYLFSRESNPSVDRPTFCVGRDRWNMLLATGEITKLGKNTGQYTCELRDTQKRESRRINGKPKYSDGGDNGRSWAIVNPFTFPQMQMVMVAAVPLSPRPKQITNARRGITHFLRSDYNNRRA